MNILAVDTSSRSLLVAVKTDSYFEESCTESADFKHSERIMGVILELLSHAKIGVNDVDLFACTRGPGSFTGLRIGMAALKGMVYGSSKPLVSVSTLQMWANTVQHFDGVVVPVIDAKKQRFYVSAFECRDGVCTRLMADTDGNTEDLVKPVEPYGSVLVCGPDKDAFAELLVPALGGRKNVGVNCDNTITPAQSLIELALKQFQEKGADDIGQGPVYLRKSDAEIALEEKRKAELANG